MSIIKEKSQVVYRFNPKQLKEIISKDMGIPSDQLELEFKIQKVANGPLPSKRVKDGVVEIIISHNPIDTTR